MAGQRYAKLTLRLSWSTDNYQRGDQTAEFRFQLGGVWETFQRGGQPGQLVVPSPNDDGIAYLEHGANNLITLLRQRILSHGYSYVVSAVRLDMSGVTAQGGGSYIGQPLAEFDLTAQLYRQSDDLDFLALTTANPTGWQVVQNLPTIRPVLVDSSVTNALIYGSATGSITLTPSNGTVGTYTYQWADETGPGQATRTNLVGPASYACTVTDASGASTDITVAVGSDPRLEVLVISTSTSIELQVSGGVPGYTYAWADGPTVALRTGLPNGTYQCRVTDTRGAFEDVEVVLTQQPYYWSRNAITLALDAGNAYRADPTTKPNLSFLCEVWVEKVYLSGVFTQVGTTLEQPADRDGRTTFEVQALLDVFLDYHVPVSGSAAPQLAAPLFRRFYLKHAQQYGLVPVPAASTSLDYHYVVRGGLSFHETQARTWFTSYQPSALPLLSWEPRTKYVFRDQPEYLYYLVQGAPGDFVRRVRVHLSDGTEQLLEYAGASGVLDCEVYCLPVGYEALGLDVLLTAPQPRQVVWWEVWMATSSGSAVLSETRRFYLDTRVFAQRRYFLFATSLGGMATYAALGQAQLDTEVTGEESARSLPPDYDVLAGDVAVLGRALRPVLKVAAGPRSQAQLRASQDLLLSPRVLLHHGTRWVPGFLKAKTVTLLDEGKLVQTQEFEFTQPTERLYTPDL
ncbi:MAG: SprB repeat-containing protein [Janthinobacterium lividum]